MHLLQWIKQLHRCYSSLTLDQGDADQEFIRFDGTLDLMDQRVYRHQRNCGSKVGAIRINVNGTDRFIRIYDSAFNYAFIKITDSTGNNKQNTEYGAEGRWVDCDNVRFRYGLPEKIGGWEKVTSDALVGAKSYLIFSDLKVSSILFMALIKNYTYSEGSYADITTRSTGTGNITTFQ